MDLFQQHPNLKIAARDEDIKKYLYQMLHQGGIYDIADQGFANKLVQNLIKGAEGMYVSP
jgi:exopolysaccharide biosynthesis predicted pyruvyltransferase EpsI